MAVSDDNASTFEQNFEANVRSYKRESNTVKGKGTVHPYTGTEALYRPYSP